MGTQIFQRQRNPNIVPDAISVTLSMFHTGDPQIIAPSYTNLLARRLCAWKMGASALAHQDVGFISALLPKSLVKEMFEFITKHEMAVSE